MGSGSTTGGAASPSSFEDPVSVKVHAWLRSLVKSLKGLRVYDENNEMLQTYLGQVKEALDEVFAEVDEFSLSVREDRILHRGDAVLVDPDRQEGLPFILFRNAFRRLTFVQGVTPDELMALMKAIVADYSAFDAAHEDLVTALWRMQLPHLRYITIDTLTIAAHAADSSDEKADIERLQGDIETLVAAVYATSSETTDIVSGLSISQEDLEALKNVRAESPEELELLDQATERKIIDLESESVEAFTAEVATQGHEELIARTMNVLVRLLFTERTSTDAVGSIELLQQMLDSMLLGRRFSHATQLVCRLQEAAEDLDDLQKLHIARQLIRLFSSTTRLIPVLVGLNDRHAGRSVSELVGFLRALGSATVPALLESLPQIDAPVHRRVIRDLIVELDLPSVSALAERLDSENDWFVIRDLLVMAAHHPPSEVASLVERALSHDNGRVREQATQMLRVQPSGRADELLADRLRDPAKDVRRTALRVAVLRRSEPCAEWLRSVLTPEGSAGHEDKDLRQMAQALAAIEGAKAVPHLIRCLNPGLLGGLRHIDLQVAAAIGLAQLKEDASRTALQRGSRSLVPRVREACRRALERQEQSAQHVATIVVDRHDAELFPSSSEHETLAGTSIEAADGAAKSFELLEPLPEPANQGTPRPELGAERDAADSTAAVPHRRDLTNDLMLDEESDARKSQSASGRPTEMLPEIDVAIPGESTPTGSDVP